MSIEECSARRRVVDANEGIGNIKDRDYLRSAVYDTADNIANILKQHYGPTGEYAVIMSRRSDDFTEIPVFTKDGINIVRCLTFMNIMQNYVKTGIEYIGTNIEKDAGDGTTTGMIFSAEFLKRLLKCDLSKHSNVAIRNAFEVFQNMFESYHDDQFVITVDQIAEYLGCSIEKAAGIVAYVQAMTSSHGDEEIARVFYDLYKELPKEYWDKDSIYIYNARYETNKKAWISYEESQFSLECTCPTGYLNNAELGSEYLEYDTNIIIFDEPIADESLAADALMRFFKEHRSQKFILIAPACGAYFTNYIHDLNHRASMTSTDNSGNYEQRVMLYIYQDKYTSGYGKALMLTACSVFANKEALNSSVDCIEWDKHIIECEKAHFAISELKLYGLVKTEDPNQVMHPAYRDPELNPKYTKILSILNNNIKDMNSSKKAFCKKSFVAFSKVRTALIFIRTPELYSGGLLHSSAAANDVLDDIISSINKSLNKGFHISNMYSMMSTIEKLHSSWEQVENCDKEIFKIITMCALKACEECVKIGVDLSEEIDTSMSGSIDANRYVNIFDIDKKEYHVGDFLRRFYENDKDDYSKIFPPIVPATFCSSVLKRFNDLLLKYVTSSHIIVPDGVFLSKSSDKNPDTN